MEDSLSPGEDLFPCLNDDKNFIPFDSHYIYHTAWATRIIKIINPEEHIDISSTLHFCKILSAFIKTKFMNIGLQRLHCQT